MKDPRGIVDLGSISGAQIIDAARGSVFVGTLVGNVIATLKSVAAGRPPVTVVFTQDGVGGRTVAWNGVGGQTVGGFTTVNSAAGSSSSFSLVASTQSSSAVTSVSNPSTSGGGGSVTSTWEKLSVFGSNLFQSTPSSQPGTGPITLDCSSTADFTVGPLSNNVQVTFTNLQAGHTYTVTYYQATSGEAAFNVTAYTPTPKMGTVYGLTNTIAGAINGVSVRVYYSDTGSDLRIIGGEDFDS